jgi:hypothetical protein
MNEFSYQQFAQHYKLTEGFEKLLYDTYVKYHNDPMITPFQLNNPPSGVLNKVSKECIQMAKDTGMDIGIEVNGYTLMVIRQKLIQLCGVGSTGLSRTNSNVGIGYPMMNLNNKFSSMQGQSPLKLDYFSFESPSGQLQSPMVNHSPQSLQSSFLAYPLQGQQTYQQGQGGLQPSFMNEQIQREQLQEQIQEQFERELVIPELYNATSNRKRESLRLKRSGSAFSYN